MASDWDAPRLTHYILQASSDSSRSHLSPSPPLLYPTTRPPPLPFDVHERHEDTPFPQLASQECVSLFTALHGDAQTGPNPLMWTLGQASPEPFPTTFSPPAPEYPYVDAMMPTRDSASQQGAHSMYQDGIALFNPNGTPWPLPSGGHSFAHDVGQNQNIHHSSNQLLDDPSAHQILSHAAHYKCPSASNHQSIAAPPSIPPHPTNSQALILPSIIRCPGSEASQPLSIRASFGCRCLPTQNPPPSLGRKPGPCAIEYGGLWLDEEELLQSQKDGDGKLTVHQCLWENNYATCHLWVACDKASINAHLQKWHGVKPGGDKLETECHWAICTKLMLKESVSRHVLSVHLGEMWWCVGCEKRLTRRDAYRRHAAESKFQCLNVRPMITYSVHVREIDARAALSNGRTLRYADA